MRTILVAVDSAVLENKSHSVEVGVIKGVSVPEGISEILANIHSVLIKAVLTSITVNKVRINASHREDHFK